jgi:alpha-1,2-mannosyltransferase
MGRLDDSTFRLRAAWSLLALSLTAWVAALRPWRWYMGDLTVYRAGSRAFLHGGELYSVVGGRHDTLHFTYPPIASIVLSPLALVPVPASKLVLSVLSAACLALSVRVALNRLSEGPYEASWWPLILSVVIWLEPIRATIAFGQVNLLVMSLVVVDVLAIRDPRRSGFLVGIAAAVKLTPLAFIPYLFLIGRRRSATNAVASFLGCLAVGYACYPSASTTYWRHHLFLTTHHVGRVENASNQSIRGITARLLRTVTVPSWWLAIAVIVFLVGVAAAVRLSHLNRPVWSLTAMAITALCVSPISWSHHWVWCALMLLSCVDLVRFKRRWPWTVGSVLVMAPFVLALVYWPPSTDHRELTDTYLQEFLSATYVLAGVALLGLLTAASVDAGPTHQVSRSRLPSASGGTHKRGWGRAGVDRKEEASESQR